MNVLVLRPAVRAMPYTLFGGGRKAVCTGRLDDYRGTGSDAEAMAQALRSVREACLAAGAAPEAVAIRAAFGGPEFAGPTVVTDEVLRCLETQVAHAPLHLPAVLALARASAAVFPEAPAVLVFETALFAALPAREYTFGLDADMARDLGLRRYGYHGIYHGAASVEAARRRETDASARTISICLEPHPEVAAIIGRQPVMVTSGATPLEGLPGETSCGEIDPSIVLLLAEEMKWGPEQINMVLARESGLAGLAGEPATVGDVLSAARPNLRAAGRVLRYRILLACGAAVAAMGGVDAIVFSGRYAAAGAKILGPTLASRLTPRGRKTRVPWHIVSDPLDRLIADQATATILTAGPGAGAAA